MTTGTYRVEWRARTAALRGPLLRHADVLQVPRQSALRRRVGSAARRRARGLLRPPAQADQGRRKSLDET